MERWKTIKGYEGLYEISNCGKIKSLITNRYLKPFDNGKGYMTIGLFKGKKRKNHYIHRLVANAFISNPNKFPEVNHKDFNKKNNKVENLEWVTIKQNKEHYRKSSFGEIGKIKRLKGLREKYNKRDREITPIIVNQYVFNNKTIEQINKLTGIGILKISKILKQENININKNPRKTAIRKRNALGRFV